MLTDRFWLSSTLNITPRQQVEFLAKLWTNALPAKQEATDLVRRMLVLESGQGWQWAGKTGSCSVENESALDHGWFVGEGLPDETAHEAAPPTATPAGPPK